MPSVIIFDNFVNVRKTPDQANCTLWTRSRSFHTHTVSKGWNSFVGVNYPFRFSGLRWSTWEGSIFLSLSRKAKESCQRTTKLKAPNYHMEWNGPCENNEKSRPFLSSKDYRHLIFKMHISKASLIRLDFWDKIEPFFLFRLNWISVVYKQTI